MTGKDTPQMPRSLYTKHTIAARETRQKPAKASKAVHEALFGADNPGSQRQMIQIAAEMQMYRGSLPPAAEVCAWEEVCPGSAERILSMAESNNRCNNANKDKIIQHNIRFENWGLASGFLALVMDMGAVVYCTMRGHDAVAVALLTLAVMGVIAKFIPVKVDPQKQD